jgi:hypothetical protein
MVSDIRRENVKTYRRIWCSKMLNQTLKLSSFKMGIAGTSEASEQLITQRCIQTNTVI